MSASPVFYNSHTVSQNYEKNILGKGKVVEADVVQGVTRSGRVYSPETLFQGNSSNGKQPAIEIKEDGILRKVHDKEYPVANN